MDDVKEENSPSLINTSAATEECSRDAKEENSQEFISKNANDVKQEENSDDFINANDVSEDDSDDFINANDLSEDNSDDCTSMDDVDLVLMLSEDSSDPESVGFSEESEEEMTVESLLKE